MKQIIPMVLIAWLSCHRVASAAEELPALPVPPQDAPGGASCANENIVHAGKCLFPVEAEQALGGGQPFDEVLWVERSKPDLSLLYLVVTDAGGPDNHVRLVVRHASAALREAAKHQGHEFNVVFFLRPSGLNTGFSVEQLREIAAASPQRAEELVREHAWSSIGEQERRPSRKPGHSD